MDFHFFQNSSTVVSDNNIAIGTDEHLVHAFGTERGLKEAGYSTCRHNVDLKKVSDTLFKDKCSRKFHNRQSDSNHQYFQRNNLLEN